MPEVNNQFHIPESKHTILDDGADIGLHASGLRPAAEAGAWNDVQKAIATQEQAVSIEERSRMVAAVVLAIGVRLEEVRADRKNAANALSEMER